MNQPDRRDGPENRRRYYRIDDEVIFRYRELSVGTGGNQLDPDEKQIEKAFLACAQLAEYRCRMQPLLGRVRRESPATAKLLGLLKDKTDLLASLMLEEELGSMGRYRSKVDLSAGGVAFRTPKEYRKNTAMAIQMILLPELVGINAQGRVIRGKKYLREIDGCLYETTVEFINMKESTRDLISKHVLEKTATQLRSTRQQARYAQEEVR